MNTWGVQDKENEKMLNELLTQAMSYRGIRRQSIVQQLRRAFRTTMQMKNIQCETMQMKIDSFEVISNKHDSIMQTINKLRATIAEKDRKIKELTRIRVILNRTGNKLMKENDDLRKKYGEELPTFLEDTELN